jgi:hypothetical protein
LKVFCKEVNGGKNARGRSRAYCEQALRGNLGVAGGASGMTTVIRPLSDSDGSRHPRRTTNDDSHETVTARQEDTEWVVDLRSKRIVRRIPRRPR